MWTPCLKKGWLAWTIKPCGTQHSNLSGSLSHKTSISPTSVVMHQGAITDCCFCAYETQADALSLIEFRPYLQWTTLNNGITVSSL